MGKRRIILSVGIVLMALLPSPASAGGWWNGLDLVGQALGVGETFSFSSEVLFPDIKTAEAANSADYRAYLVRGIDQERLDKAMGRAEGGDWWSTPEEMTQIGTVTFSDRDSNLSTATAHLDVPDVPAGSYNLMLCSPGCVEPVGDLIPIKVRVSSDPAMAAEVRRLTQKEWDLRSALAGTKRDLRQTNQKLIAAESEAEAEAAPPVERDISATPAAETTPWWSYAVWFMGGAVLTLVALQLGQRKRVPSAQAQART